jgi:hypothetical protein
LFVATNFRKLNIILFLKCRRKKFGPNFTELLKFLPKKLSLSSQKYGFGIRDTRSGIRKKPIPVPDPGVKKAPDPGSRIWIRNTAFHYFTVNVFRIKATQTTSWAELNNSNNIEIKNEQINIKIK